MPTPSIATVLLHWRNGDALQRQLRELATWSLAPLNFVVENEPLSWPDPGHPRLVALQPSANLGYAGGVNLALREILQRGIPFALLLNADLDCPEQTALALLRAIESDPTIGLIGPMLEERDGRGQVRLFAGGRNPVWHLQTRRPVGAEVRAMPSIQPVDYTPGTVCLLRMSMLQKIGWLEESYFFSGEMADLGWRARRAGFRCAVHTGARARHFSGDAGPLRETLYLYYTLRNRLLLARRCAPAAWPLAWAVWTVFISLIALRQFFRGKRTSARAALRALRDGWRKEHGRAPSFLEA